MARSGAKKGQICGQKKVPVSQLHLLPLPTGDRERSDRYSKFTFVLPLPQSAFLKAARNRAFFGLFLAIFFASSQSHFTGEKVVNTRLTEVKKRPHASAQVVAIQIKGRKRQRPIQRRSNIRRGQRPVSRGNEGRRTKKRPPRFNFCKGRVFCHALQF